MKTRKLTIIAQDPSILNASGKILRTEVNIPYENLAPGPRGYRLNIIDYDSTQRVLYKPFIINDNEDKFKEASDSELLTNPGFHAQNVYAIIMRLLTRFEFAFGRRVSWGNDSHQLNISPHAFADANAFYSPDANGLFFGYFVNETGKNIFTCLSHDVVVHEAAHAILDGIRKTYILPSYPDQAGFHEGFADSVAILSVFGLKDVVKTLLLGGSGSDNYIKKEKLSANNIKKNVLLSLAEEFGSEITGHASDSLRRAVLKKPSKSALKDPLYQQPHLRGEILSAAIINSFVEVWVKRLNSWLPEKDERVLINRVVEDASDAANHLLTMCIRALDYCPVVDITYNEFLTSLLTADYELVADDSKYTYRHILKEQFGRWGIVPVGEREDKDTRQNDVETWGWEKINNNLTIDYDNIHRDALEVDRNEAFKFLWQNRKTLGLFENAFTQIISQRSSIRVAPDGFVLRETVCEYKQSIELEAKNLSQLHKEMQKPKGMPDNTLVRINGGGVLVFDDFGKLKYHIAAGINDAQRQNQRLEYLWKTGLKDRFNRYGFSEGSSSGKKFSNSIFDVNEDTKLKSKWLLKEEKVEEL